MKKTPCRICGQKPLCFRCRYRGAGHLKFLENKSPWNWGGLPAISQPTSTRYIWKQIQTKRGESLKTRGEKLHQKTLRYGGIFFTNGIRDAWSTADFVIHFHVHTFSSIFIYFIHFLLPLSHTDSVVCNIPKTVFSLTHWKPWMQQIGLSEDHIYMPQTLKRKW